MKIISKIIGVFILAAIIFSQVSPTICFSQEYKLSTDPRLAEPKKSFEKAQEYMVKGNEEFRRRPGLAQKMFEHAEDYFLKASFLYSELGERYGIDVSHEIATCERSQRHAHVRVGKARKKSRHGSIL